MVFRITSTKGSSRRKKAGLTLVEFLVALGIGGLVLAGLASLMFYTGRSFAALANYVDLDAYSRNALDTMSREIRQTRRLATGTSTRLQFEDFDGGTLVYQYNPDARTLTRSKNGVPDSQPLLRECNFLQFSMFQRNPINGQYNQYPTAVAAQCKLVQLRWICSRDLIQSRKNTESVQSAKIVIRRQ